MHVHWVQAVSTNIASDGMEAARRACGGHGYSLLSGLPTTFTHYVQNVTWEGDNNVMLLQAMPPFHMAPARSVSHPTLAACWLTCAYLRAALLLLEAWCHRGTLAQQLCYETSLRNANGQVLALMVVDVGCTLCYFLSERLDVILGVDSKNHSQTSDEL